MIREIVNYNEPVTVILDANAYVHTSFHAYDPRFDKKGKDQRVLHGLLDTLVGLTYSIDRIDELFIVFDPINGSLFRESMFPSYKAHRPPKDPDLLRQSQDAQHVLKNGFGLQLITYSGYEADDIIGSIAAITSKQTQTIVVSPDKDLAQLVNENTFLLRKKKARGDKGYVLMDEQKVVEDFGVHPTKIADWLALMGDVSDGLPGLDKVGNKTAIKILSQYPSVEHLLSIANHIEDVKLKAKVLGASETLPLIKQLATIVCDLPISDHIIEVKKETEAIRNSAHFKKKILLLEEYFDFAQHYKDLFL